MAHIDPRLAELSRELERLAGLLSALANEGTPPQMTPALVRMILALRMMWSEHFGAGLGEPARNMLLALYAARLEGRELPPTRLAAAAVVPLATALRWIDIMARRQLLLRRPDPEDRRRTLLALSPDAIAGIDAYLAAIFKRPFLVP